MIRRRHRKLLVRIMSGFLALTLSCSTSGSFFSIFDSNNDKHFPSAGEPSGNDSVSASTNMSGKEEGTSPKLDPLSGTVQIPAPQIGNYGTVNLSYQIGRAHV